MEEQRQQAELEAKAVPDRNLRERMAMEELFKKYHLREESIRPDGNCLYAAFASQLKTLNIKDVSFCEFAPY